MDVEGGREETRRFPLSLWPWPKFQIRGESFVPEEGGVAAAIRRHRENESELKAGATATALSLSNSNLGKETNVVDWSPSVETGAIIVKEKVLANGAVPKYAWRLDGRIKAVEMEGYGFAAACRHMGMPWAIFRGIADFADKKKSDEWHLAAASAAAHVARHFLVRTYSVDVEDPVF